jgi:prepilin signal peptidase PulO-like enzyme (type II secretory pathway)
MMCKEGVCSQNTLHLAVDLVIFLLFLVVEAPRFSGLPVHEWLGIAIGAGAITHVLLHWSWVIEISKRSIDDTDMAVEWQIEQAVDRLGGRCAACGASRGAWLGWASVLPVLSTQQRSGALGWNRTHT